MIRKFCVLCFALIGLWNGALDAYGQERVSIIQCYEWARNNYPQIRQFDLIGQTEQYNLSNAGKAWLPQVAVNAKATYQSDVTKLPFDMSKISSMLPGIEQAGFQIPTLSKDQYQVVAEVSQTLWDGGAVRSVRALTQAEATASRKQLESDLYALRSRVNQLYFGTLLQDELLAQNAVLQKDLQVNLERVVAMIANGVANESDRESLEVEILKARQSEIELSASRSAYLQMLSLLTGQSLSQAFLEVPSWSGAPMSQQINRPELQALDAQIDLLETQNKQVTAGLMPRLGAFIQGGYGRPGLNMLENEFNPFYVAGVRLSWNLGKLYTLKNDRRKIETSVRGMHVQRETFLFNTRLQMLQQNEEIRKMTDLMRTDDDIIRLRGSIKRAAEVKLENGVISVTDLIREINAEDLSRQAASVHRMQQLLSVYNYMYLNNEE